MAAVYIDQNELSQQIGVPVRTIEDWRRRRTGPAFVRVGRAVRYAQSAVDKWLKANEQVAA